MAYRSWSGHYPATDNGAMPPRQTHTLMGFSPRTIGLAAAVVTVLIWTSFIVIARASLFGVRIQRRVAA